VWQGKVGVWGCAPNRSAGEELPNPSGNGHGFGFITIMMMMMMMIELLLRCGNDLQCE